MEIFQTKRLKYPNGPEQYNLISFQQKKRMKIIELSSELL